MPRRRKTLAMTTGQRAPKLPTAPSPPPRKPGPPPRRRRSSPSSPCSQPDSPPPGGWESPPTLHPFLADPLGWVYKLEAKYGPKALLRDISCSPAQHSSSTSPSTAERLQQDPGPSKIHKWQRSLPHQDDDWTWADPLEAAFREPSPGYAGADESEEDARPRQTHPQKGHINSPATPSSIASSLTPAPPSSAGSTPRSGPAADGSESEDDVPLALSRKRALAASSNGNGNDREVTLANKRIKLQPDPLPSGDSSSSRHQASDGPSTQRAVDEEDSSIPRPATAFTAAETCVTLASSTSLDNNKQLEQLEPLKSDKGKERASSESIGDHVVGVASVSVDKHESKSDPTTHDASSPIEHAVSANNKPRGQLLEPEKPDRWDAPEAKHAETPSGESVDSASASPKADPLDSPPLVTRDLDEASPQITEADALALQDTSSLENHPTLPVDVVEVQKQPKRERQVKTGDDTNTDDDSIESGLHRTVDDLLQHVIDLRGLGISKEAVDSVLRRAEANLNQAFRDAFDWTDHPDSQASAVAAVAKRVEMGISSLRLFASDLKVTDALFTQEAKTVGEEIKKAMCQL